MKCPRCITIELKEKKYEGIEIDSCDHCHGSWLANSELTHIVQIREVTFPPELVDHALASAKGGIPETELAHDLNCPECYKPMKPINYGINSGIIIDRCTQDHGLWFDGLELEKIQAYREYWQDNTESNQEKLHKLINIQSKNHKDESPSLLFAAAEFLSKYL